MSTSTVFAASGPGDGSQTSKVVDSAASGNLLDPFLIPGLTGLMRAYCFLDVSHERVTTGQYVHEGIVTGTIHGHLTDVSGANRLITLSAVLVLGLERTKPVIGCDVVSHGY